MVRSELQTGKSCTCKQAAKRQHLFPTTLKTVRRSEFIAIDVMVIFPNYSPNAANSLRLIGFILNQSECFSHSKNTIRLSNLDFFDAKYEMNLKVRLRQLRLK